MKRKKSQGKNCEKHDFFLLDFDRFSNARYSLGKYRNLASASKALHNTPSKRRAYAYALLTQARKIMYAEGQSLVDLDFFQFPNQLHSTSKCHFIRFGAGDVAVHQDERGKCFYNHLVKCKSVWSCPVCASHYSEKKRRDIQKMGKYLWGKGYKAMMLTYTFPHKWGQNLKSLHKDNLVESSKNHVLIKDRLGNIDKMMEAFRRFRSTKSAWGKFKKESGFGGLVRSLELKFGENGFHPHFHELVFVDKKYKFDLMLEFKKAWKRSLQTSLVTIDKEKAFDERSITLVDNCQVSDYITKAEGLAWGYEKELIKHTFDRGGLSVFDVLSCLFFSSQDLTEYETDFLTRLYVCFCFSMKRKNKIFFCKTLHKHMREADEKYNWSEEFSDCCDIDKVLCTLSFQEWKNIRETNRLSEFLDYVEEHKTKQGFLF